MFTKFHYKLIELISLQVLYELMWNFRLNLMKLELATKHLTSTLMFTTYNVHFENLKYLE